MKSMTMKNTNPKKIERNKKAQKDKIENVAGSV
jgi:hypothetical protein